MSLNQQDLEIKKFAIEIARDIVVSMSSNKDSIVRLAEQIEKYLKS